MELLIPTFFYKKQENNCMIREKEIAIRAIEKKRDRVIEAADRIWEYAELSLMEKKSAELYCKMLEEEGFQVERGFDQIETAFAASYGKGGPVIGILAEYDALSGLSQKGGSLTREEVVSGGCGHGCGHNLLGAGAFAAALGVKAYLEETGDSGTVILYGCPGEEGGASKAFMARDGVWKNLDAALTWHPEDVNEVATGSSNSCIQVQYKFKGVASHAAGAPEQGRSALDAVELMNIGVQFLREHMSDKARIHYAITDAGGVSPNVVQPRASVLYMVRSNHVAEAVSLQERVDKIAEGAALMTDTTFERKFIDGLADTISNFTLEKALYENFKELGVPEYTQEEQEFADALAKTYPDSDQVPGVAAEFDQNLRLEVQALREENGHAMNAFLAPLYQGEAFKAGSTDVGDVSWLTPTGQIHVAAWPNGCPGHSWQNVSSGRTSIGHKAALHAGKVLAATAIDLMRDPDLLKAARTEFTRRTAAGYTCPIPADAVPVVPDL
jgi:aminobenzoyl-glutamate utilization protein B